MTDNDIPKKYKLFMISCPRGKRNLKELSNISPLDPCK